MMAVFSEFIEEIVEVFMDDFSVYGKTFMDCLANLEKILMRCVEVDLVLNWEKCHFMVKQGIVLGHVISERGIEVDKAEVETVEQLPPPMDVKSLRSFLCHCWGNGLRKPCPRPARLTASAHAQPRSHRGVFGMPV
jgi:hypothetical protein